jgi:tRNA/rRNA methyltransferase
MNIPTCEVQISMNLGQAAAVCLYELARDAKAARQAEKPEPAAAGEVERITALLFDALRASGYVNPDPPASAEQKLRRLVRRLDLPAGDAEVWLGMLRQILWKLQSE